MGGDQGCSKEICMLYTFAAVYCLQALVCFAHQLKSRFAATDSAGDGLLEGLQAHLRVASTCQLSVHCVLLAVGDTEHHQQPAQWGLVPALQHHTGLTIIEL